MAEPKSRRTFLLASGLGGAGLLLGCRSADRGSPGKSAPRTTSAEVKQAGKDDTDGEREPEVTATEDLMREHGVIRRALVVYREAAARLRTKPSALPSGALLETARLLRTFAEDYHERALEEEQLFPAVKRGGGAAGALVDVLIGQHARGREITDYVIASTAAASVRDPNALAGALEGFARMYEEHAALEDTVVFPTWKGTMSARERKERAETFEEIEHRTFGKDGFEDARDRVAAVERSLGIDLGRFTPPAPPRG